MIWLAAPDPKLDRRYFIIRDYKGQALTFVSFEEESGRRSARSQMNCCCTHLRLVSSRCWIAAALEWRLIASPAQDSA
jgi:hypothetical protein